MSRVSKKTSSILKNSERIIKNAKKRLKLDKVDFYNSEDSLSLKSKPEEVVQKRERTKERRKLIYLSKGVHEDRSFKFQQEEKYSSSALKKQPKKKEPPVKKKKQMGEDSQSDLNDTKRKYHLKKQENSFQKKAFKSSENTSIDREISREEYIRMFAQFVQMVENKGMLGEEINQ